MVAKPEAAKSVQVVTLCQSFLSAVPSSKLVLPCLLFSAKISAAHENGCSPTHVQNVYMSMYEGEVTQQRLATQPGLVSPWTLCL